MQKILVCDDDRQIVEAIDIYLTGEGFEVIKAYDGLEALELLKTHEVNLMIVDVMMPGLDGYTVARQVRARHLGTPILMLTARDEIPDKIAGLDHGADDYMTKPFDIGELLARVRAILRRTQGSQPPRGGSSDEVRFMDLVLQPGLQQASCHGDLLELTATEFNLLELLLRSPERVVSKDELSLHGLGRPREPYDRSVDVHICNIRQKLQALAGEAVGIETARSIGYRLACSSRGACSGRSCSASGSRSS